MADLHFPVNIPFGRSHLPLHLIFEMAAYFLGYRYYAWLRSRGVDLITTENRFKIFCGAAIGAFLGAHVVGVLERPDQLHQLTFAYFLANKTITGGFIGGLIGVELIKKAIGVNVSSGDMMVYPLILAMIIGRMGCFFAGLEDGTYGIETNLPWAINFGDGVRRHPTNLYEIVFWILLWLALRYTEIKVQLANGARFKLLLSSYLVFRLLIEFIKPNYFFSFGLSVIQLLCIGGILYYYKVFTSPKSLVLAHA